MYVRYVTGPVLITAIAAAGLATGVTLAKVRKAHGNNCPAQGQCSDLAHAFADLNRKVECRLMAASLMHNPDDPRWTSLSPRET